MGLIYRLVITNIDGFGDVGNGYYSAGFQIYTLLLALSSVGIPSAVSKLVAQAEAAGDHRQSKDIFRTALALFFGIGLVCAAALYLGADFIARYVIRMDGVQGTLRALSPAVLFVCLSSVLRGYYLGLGSAKAAGSSQVVEQFLKSVLTVVIVLVLTGYSAQAMSAGANFATSIAAGGGTAYLASYHIRAKRKAERSTTYRKLSKRSLFTLSKTILRLSIPVSTASIIASVGSVIDTGTISRGIAAAFAGGIPGQASVPSAQELSQEAVGMIFIALNQTVTGGLQGFGLVSIPAKALLWGVIVKVALNLLLIRIPAVNIYGAPIASAACYLTAFWLGYHRLCRIAPPRYTFPGFVWKTALCAGIMGAAARLVYQAMCSLLHSNALALLITIAGSAVLYFALLLAIDRKLELKSGSRISNRKGDWN